MKLTELLRRLQTRRTRRAPAEEASATRETDAARASAEADESQVDPFDPFPEPVVLEIRDRIDLHSIRPRETGAVVEEYLHQARLKGFRQVRIIHGKGVGVQREIVRRILARTPFVVYFADAPAEAGGWGATLVRLSLEDEAGPTGADTRV